jgi:hypothetical protein
MVMPPTPVRHHVNHVCRPRPRSAAIVEGHDEDRPTGRMIRRVPVEFHVDGRLWALAVRRRERAAAAGTRMPPDAAESASPGSGVSSAFPSAARPARRPQSNVPADTTSTLRTTTRAATRSVPHSRSTGSSTRSIRCWSPRSVSVRIPPPGGNELIFLGRYYLTSSAPQASLATCPDAANHDHAVVPFRGHRARQRHEHAPVDGRLFPASRCQVRQP